MRTKSSSPLPPSLDVPARVYGGYVIVYKLLEAGIFRFPAPAEGQASVTVRAAELATLLDGVDWQNAKRSKRYYRPATG